jgi:hypothetical protein
MAKKTTSRSNAEPKPDADEATAAAKPRSRSRATKPQPSDAPVAMANDRATTVGDSTATPTVGSTPGNGAVLDDQVTSVSMASEPSEEDIRMRAYHRYLERGGGHGLDFDDWLEAERELRESRARR